MNSLQLIENEISGLRMQLQKHKLYKNLNNIDDIKVFGESRICCLALCRC